MKICIFPNDSLLSYYEKGEIKKGYFNPKNYFEEVHVLSLFEQEIKEEKVKIFAGNSTLKIHNIGKVNLTNYKKFEDSINKLIDQIKPNIIRAYNPLIQGWFAVKVGKKLNIPVVVSVHTNYDQQREFAKQKRDYLQYLKLKYTSKKLENFVLSNADAVICVYEFIVPYAKKFGANNVHVIYNRVDLDQFTPYRKKEKEFDKPTILSVGRLQDQKDHSHLIKAIKTLDVNLLIIGDGPNYNKLKKLTDSLEVKGKVTIIKKVPNEKLPGYYVSCDVYAQPMENLGGIPIPVLEAMASGLPVVMSKRDKEENEIIDDAVYFVENNSRSFRKAFEKILTDHKLQEDLKKKSLSKIEGIGGSAMEDREIKLYQELLKVN